MTTLTLPPAARPAVLSGGARAAFRTIPALILREMSSTYGRSPGGYLWAVVEPVAAIALMSVAFSFILRAPGLGDNFSYFYATGFLPFSLYMTVSMQVSAALRFSRPLLEYPRVSYLDAVLARFILNLMTQILVLAVVMTGIVVVFNLVPRIDVAGVGLTLLLASGLALGVGCVNCFLITSFPVWERVWAIANRPMFLISAVLFLPEDLPERYREWLMLNPLAHITSLSRSAFFTSYDAVSASPLYVTGWVIGLLTLGLFLLATHHKEILLK
ncbi:MAG: ABC transporter permease [Celeribacter sp.]|jgi:capsular polysaccharide transport system permease protein